MFDTTIVAFSVAFLVVAGLTAVAAAAAVVLAVRDLRSTPEVVVSVVRPERELVRAA